MEESSMVHEGNKNVGKPIKRLTDPRNRTSHWTQSKKHDHWGKALPHPQTRYLS